MDKDGLNILIAIIGSAIGALVVWFSTEINERFQSRRGELTGTWQQCIPLYKDQPEKVDEVTCRHIHGKLTGKIRRIRPPDQRNKSWEFEFKIRRSLIFGTFWSTDSLRNPGSYGTIQLNMINENRLEGFYVKLMVKSMGADMVAFTDELEQIPFFWTRENPSH